MPQCFVTNCSNYYGKTRGKVNVMYHIFPSKSELAAKWSVLCGYKKDFKAPAYARVCSEHFTPNCYQRDLQHELLGLPLRKKLKVDAVPNRNLPNQTSSNQKQLKDSQLNKKKVNSVIKSSLVLISGNKSKNISSGGQMTNKNNKKQLENMTVGNTSKPKVKCKPGLNKSHSVIRISINDLCRNRSTIQRRSDPLKETTVNKIERKLTDEVTIEKVGKVLTVEDINKLTKQVTLDAMFSKKGEKMVGLSTREKVKNEQELKKEKKSTSNSSYSGRSYEHVKTSGIAKSCKNHLWVNRRERLPMRSSIRIAKKKSIESLSESFTTKVNSKKGDQECKKRERFSDKLKFMALLQLRYFRNKIELDEFYGQAYENISSVLKNR